MLGLCYLILAGLFFSMLFITARCSRSYEDFFTELLKSIIDINFIFIYMVLNSFLSLIIGVTLIILGKNHKLFLNLLFVMASILMILDVIPVGQEVFHFIMTKSANIPWTIIILGFHSYFLYSFSIIRKREVNI